MLLLAEHTVKLLINTPGKSIGKHRKKIYTDYGGSSNSFFVKRT